MLNFLKKVFLGIVAIIVPVCLNYFMSAVVDNDIISAIGVLLSLGIICFAWYQFRCIGKYYDAKLVDAFWATLVLGAACTLAFTICVTLYGWFCMDANSLTPEARELFLACGPRGDLSHAFRALPYAFAPVCLSIAYVCILGIIICSLRLKYNKWNMSGTERALIWAIIGVLGFLASGTIAEVNAKYIGIMVPEVVRIAIICIGVFSILSMFFCGGKLACQQNR